LKNIGGKTVDGLTALPTDRRVILSGTPVQNNLEELFGMCHFVCPGVLGMNPYYLI
jgi:SNF2 family DNA or RNA helicase